MRRQANAAATLGADHLLLFQALEELAVVPSGQAEGENPGAARGFLRAEQTGAGQAGNALVQTGDALLQQSRHLRHADLLE
ncbi:hypothetical protein D3C75_1285700 [compost metagenome]